jgi:hypothetical protein
VIYLDVQRRAARSQYGEARSEYEQNATPSAGDDVDDAAARFYRSRNLEITMGVISGVLAATGSALLLYHPIPESDEAARHGSPDLGLGMSWAGAF